MADKYKATWVSHSSISDFLNCPRAYYLKNVYKDPKTKHKIQLISPPLSLGAAVHSVIEGLSVLPTDERFSVSLIKKFDQEWKKYSGIKGGFFDEKTELAYKERGAEMLRRVMNNPGPLSRLAVKIKEDLPWFWLSEEDWLRGRGWQFFTIAHLSSFSTLLSASRGGKSQLLVPGIQR